MCLQIETKLMSLTHYATKFTIHFKRYIVFYVPLFYCSFIANRQCHKELLVVMCSHEFLCFRCYMMPLRSLLQDIFKLSMSEQKMGKHAQA